MHIKQLIEQYLGATNKTTVALEELERLFVGDLAERQAFIDIVLEMEQMEMLQAVKAAGRTMKKPSLAYRYRINKQAIRRPYVERLQHYQLSLHSKIQLEAYFSLAEEQFERDEPWIALLNQFLKTSGLPNLAAAAPERSFQLTGNEKWISELGGEALLRRTGLWDLLLIHPVADPLMFAINPASFEQGDEKPCLHLIVENKTTFQALLPCLNHSRFSTLIYGCGNKITGNLDMFFLQYPVQGKEHYFYYFGDVDAEGIRIWHEANKRQAMIPAMPFYEACLEKAYVLGKANQRRSEEACQSFLTYFSKVHQEQIMTALQAGGYYPQEILTTQQLQEIWRSSQWQQWIELI